MTQIAAVYTVLFFLIGAWSALTDFRDRKPFAEVTAEAAAICLLSVGNCFWLIGFSQFLQRRFGILRLLLQYLLRCLPSSVIAAAISRRKWRLVKT